MTGQTPAPFRALEVALDPGITLVEASAGTGKTFAITRLLLRLLLERRVESLARILVVTFTEKATQELVTRIRKTLREAERVWSASPPPRTSRNDDLFVLRERHGDAGRAIVDEAMRSLDDLAVFTIHGFCQRVLGESALESRIPFRTTFIEDDTEPFGRAARDWARKRLINDAADATLVAQQGKPFEPWVKKLVIPYRRHEASRIAFDSASREQGLLAHFTSVVHESFEREKERRHLRGFDDLLRTVTIRHEPHTVVQCIHRQLTHYGYHVGQIVLLARQARGPAWTALSIPRRQSGEFNATMQERHRGRPPVSG